MFVAYKKGDGNDSSSSEEDIRWNWKSVAEAYSSRKLTHQQDKVAALAGITDFTRALLGDAPFMGL